MGYPLIFAASSWGLLKRIIIIIPLLFWFNGIILIIFFSFIRDKRRSYLNIMG